MGHSQRDNTVLYFSIPTAALVITASLCGFLCGNIYSHETSAWVAQAIGQDLVNVAVIVPTILVSAFLLRSGKRAALLVWLGTMMYTAYTFVIYSFSVHFNPLFLVYCWALGLSAYAFITVVVKSGAAPVKEWFDEARGEYLVSTVVLLAGVLFYLLWLKEDLPAMLGNRTPDNLQASGLMTNPVHVLDYSLILPGFIVSSILLMKKHAIGYLLAPVFLIFGILMYVTIAILVVVMQMKGITDTAGAAIVFLLFAVVGTLVLLRFLRHMKKATR